MSQKEAYRQFCMEAEDLPIFFQDWYLDGVCEDSYWDILLEIEDHQIVAAMPFFLKQKGPFKMLTMPLFVKHMGPYLIPEKRKLKYEQRFYKKFLEQLPSFDSFLQDFHPTVKNWLPFFWKNFKQSTRYTYVLEDLSDLEKVFQNFNRNIRRNIKKAEKVLQIRSDLPLETFYKINRMSFERQGIPIYFSFEQLQKHDASLHENQARKIFYAVDEKEQIHAVSYLIWDKKRSYYHLAGEHPDFRGSGASILLTWEAIKFTKEELGLNIFDFEGSMLEPIEAIRAQFGGKQVPYFRIWKYKSKVLELLNAVRSIF